jgi:hypothetical protein
VTCRCDTRGGYKLFSKEQAKELHAAGYSDIEDDVTLDMAARPSGATPRLENVIARLQALLMHDAVVADSVAAGRAGELVDLGLARYFMRDPELRKAVAALDDDDIREHEGRRRVELQHDWQREIAGDEHKVIGHRYPERHEAEWMQSGERAAALLRCERSRWRGHEVCNAKDDDCYGAIESITRSDGSCSVRLQTLKSFCSRPSPRVPGVQSGAARCARDAARTHRVSRGAAAHHVR